MRLGRGDKGERVSYLKDYEDYVEIKGAWGYSYISDVIIKKTTL